MARTKAGELKEEITLKLSQWLQKHHSSDMLIPS